MTRVNVAVVVDGGHGSRLVIRLKNLHPSNVMGGAPVAVTPAQVAGCIATALDAGWRPDVPGPVFELLIP